jgi:hypothetical protein
MKIPAHAILLSALALTAMRLPAATITLSYTEFFDYSITGIVGHPDATWSATFDPSLEPENPFASTPSSVNQDFILSGLTASGAPSLIWAAGDISGAGPASFELGGTSYVVLPFFPLFPSCSLPCSEVANHPGQATELSNPAASFFASTPDTFTGFATVPEPSTAILFGIALASAWPSVKRRWKGIAAPGSKSAIKSSVAA